MRLSRRFSFAALMLLLTGAGAWAQLSTAQLSGRVTDESGAVLPGVTVTAAGIGTVIENERILELPLQGRQVTDLSRSTFGRITTQATDPRILQFGVKYGF